VATNARGFDLSPTRPDLVHIDLVEMVIHIKQGNIEMLSPSGTIAMPERGQHGKCTVHAGIHIA